MHSNDDAVAGSENCTSSASRAALQSLTPVLEYFVVAAFEVGPTIPTVLWSRSASASTLGVREGLPYAGVGPIEPFQG